MEEAVLRRTGSQLRLPLLGPSEAHELPTIDDAGGGGGGAGASDDSGSVPPSPDSHHLAGANLQQSVFNLVNIYVGLGLLTMPFATAKGGWAALAVLAAMVPLFGLSGLLICAAFDALPRGCLRTFPELGNAAAGAAGRRAVLAFCSLELFGATTMLLLVAWQQLELLLPATGLGGLSPMHLAAAITTAGLAPLLFIELRRLAPLSVAGSTSTALVLALVLALLPLDPRRQGVPQQPPPTHHLLSRGILQSCGIFALSCSAHSTLPALRSSMAHPARFPAALSIAFGAMLATYASLAAAGYWYWGDCAAPLVTADLAARSLYAGAAVPVDRALALLVLLGAATKYPGLNLILQDMILLALPLAPDAQGRFRPPLRRVTHGLRLVILGAGTALALAAYRRLGDALSLLGGFCSITVSLVLPTTFYLLLAWRRLGWARRAGLAAMLALGLALVVSVTATNICDMVPACRQRHVHLAGGGAWAGLAGPGPA